jgi:hypothetical protein
MSASHEWTELHLTPRGWEPGSEKEDFQPVREVPPPEDRVLTIKKGEHMSSGASPLTRYSKEIWRSSDKKLVDELLAKFGER